MFKLYGSFIHITILSDSTLQQYTKYCISSFLKTYNKQIVNAISGFWIERVVLKRTLSYPIFIITNGHWFVVKIYCNYDGKNSGYSKNDAIFINTKKSFE